MAEPEIRHGDLSRVARDLERASRERAVPCPYCSQPTITAAKAGELVHCVTCGQSHQIPEGA
jgi:ribosomal protein S27E